MTAGNELVIGLAVLVLGRVLVAPPLMYWLALWEDRYDRLRPSCPACRAARAQRRRDRQAEREDRRFARRQKRRRSGSCPGLAGRTGDERCRDGSAEAPRAPSGPRPGGHEDRTHAVSTGAPTSGSEQGHV